MGERDQRDRWGDGRGGLLPALLEYYCCYGGGDFIALCWQHANGANKYRTVLSVKAAVVLICRTAHNLFWHDFRSDRRLEIKS